MDNNVVIEDYIGLKRSFVSYITAKVAIAIILNHKV